MFLPQKILLAGILVLAPTLAAADLVIENAYGRAASAMARSGAAFMAITNTGDTADTLIGAQSDVAERVELHTHIQTAEGVMRMIEVEGGIPLPPAETVLLDRGGLHVMLLGLTRPLAQGDTFTLTLEFDAADPLTIEVPVDLMRMPGQGDGAMPRQHGGGHGLGQGQPSDG